MIISGQKGGRDAASAERTFDRMAIEGRNMSLNLKEISNEATIHRQKFQ